MSTIILRWQNSRADRNIALTKCWRRRRRIPYCLARKSPQQLTSPRPCWRSPTSPRWCWYLRMQSSSKGLPLAAPILWADSLPYRTGLLYRHAMQKMSQIWHWQNIGGCQDLMFSTGLWQSISQLLGVQSKHLKSKNIQTCLLCETPPSTASHSRPSWRSTASCPGYPNEIWPMCGGGG